MTRIQTPDINSLPTRSQELLGEVKKKLGSVPNLFALLGNSPQALSSYLNLGENLGTGSLGPALQEPIALSVAEFNGCEYCLAAHSLIGEKIAGLTNGEIIAARQGRSADSRSQAVLSFVQEVLKTRGHVTDESLEAIRRAGISDGEVAEIAANIAHNVLTNYLNNVARTGLDFPRVPALAEVDIQSSKP